MQRKAARRFWSTVGRGRRSTRRAGGALRFPAVFDNHSLTDTELALLVRIGPTVILHSNPADKALHDEIFGPVLSILEVESKERAIEIENKNPYGNAAWYTHCSLMIVHLAELCSRCCSIYTNSGGTADWFSKRFSVGMVCLRFASASTNGSLIRAQVGVNIGVPVPREPFSFGGSNISKFGDLDITGARCAGSAFAFIRAMRLSQAMAQWSSSRSARKSPPSGTRRARSPGCLKRLAAAKLILCNVVAPSIMLRSTVRSSR